MTVCPCFHDSVPVCVRVCVRVCVHGRVFVGVHVRIRASRCAQERGRVCGWSKGLFVCALLPWHPLTVRTDRAGGREEQGSAGHGANEGRKVKGILGHEKGGGRR